jgi:tripartite-type tricarboxylate transporter receptor subunit TctC
MFRTRTIAGLAAIATVASATFAIAPAARAQADVWPAKPIRLVAPFPPGGTTDQLARIFAPVLSQSLGQQVVVENRAGGGGSIGTGQVAKSAPDGYTFVLVFDTHGVNPSLIPNMPFDTKRDLAPVMLIATGPMVITAHRTQPYKTFGELIAAARAKPGAVTYGSIGSGSLGHLAVTQMGAQGKFQMSHIPYKGGGPLAQDTVAGHVPVSIATTALLSQHIRAGTIVPLAVTSRERDPMFPNVPTVSESGVPGFEASAWWGLLAPAKTPAAIVERMNAECAKILKDPKIAERLTQQGMIIRASSPAELGRFVEEQVDRWAKVVKEFGISAGD